MAGLLLCGRQSDKPYYIESIDMNVYSVEEIGYYIFNHINFVYREFFCDELFDYLENELERKDLADRLRSLAENDSKTSEMIMCILEGSSYYTSYEISQIYDVIINIDSLSYAERLKMEADALYSRKNYGSALKIYNEILDAREKYPLGGPFYARIAYSIGTVYARLYMSKSANHFFSIAYELSPNPVYAKACVYMSIINDDDEELLNTIIDYKVTDEALASIKQAVDAACTEIEDSKEMKDFMDEFAKGTNYIKIIDDWKKEYYNMLG